MSSPEQRAREAAERACRCLEDCNPVSQRSIEHTAGHLAAHARSEVRRALEEAADICRTDYEYWTKDLSPQDGRLLRECNRLIRALAAKWEEK